MRIRFDEQLELLHTEMIEMGALCEEAIGSAAKALLAGDREMARRITAMDNEIDDKERKIEDLCLKLLLQQQPVARDLRRISSALKMITDMERLGDHAADIAEITALSNIGPGDDLVHIDQMAKATIKMVTESIDAYVRQDLELVHQVIAYDDVVDGLFDDVKRTLIELIGQDKSRGEYVIDMLMIAKYFERIGDHATNIAEWVEFSITGKHKGEAGI